MTVSSSIPGRFFLAALAAVLVMCADPACGQQTETRRQSVRIFGWQELRWNEDVPVRQDEEGFVSRFAGQSVERTLKLADAMPGPAETPRIELRLLVEPKMTRQGGKLRPNDVWTRLGNVTVLAPSATGPVEVELMRFVTGYGHGGRYRADVTPYAPLLFGTRTFRVFVSTFSESPGWQVALELVYFYGQGGYRRPSLVIPLFDNPHVAHKQGQTRRVLTQNVVIPPGLNRPRIRLTSTGHSTDGAGEHEFVSATHILRIDGQVIARWRPWSERGHETRSLNPWAFRQEIQGREIWSSDFDRSGWNPGLMVDPLIVPAPELVPGPHRIDLEIEVLAPPPDAEEGHHGYWYVNGAVVADEPWPAE